ncbi:futalosine hydrolase [Jatrophihabitans endophyticus]|uniref:Futalosine hydrolase n=1 Tax=Jatrophihabitans endophyticus TaxID=1206085 RepID=A0A1M5RH50_9ACTN|nr:futalosine hydrolase [Jatrophihabitans endophyticus]SHH25538.1 futalosine hydrolase [Jatrophihabitans endophyticus]
MITAVEAEAAAIRAALPRGAAVRVVVGGVGPAAAAATAGRELVTGADLVVSAGIGGGFAPLAPGAIAVATTSVFADLGADTAEGFVPMAELGFGVAEHPVPAKLAVELADRTGGHLGTVLTVATVTGTAERAAALARRYPDAVAEAMEGAGVAIAATHAGVPFAELRTISNAVGPRDRAAWRIEDALAALGRAVAEATA